MIYIPTYLRGDAQPMYRQLNDAGLAPVLVVDKSDPFNYEKFRHYRIDVHGIAQKREWIANHTLVDVHIVADDDLQILSVLTDGRTILAEKAGVRHCISMMEQLAEHYAHGGVHRRAFVNASSHKNYKINTGGYGSLLFYNKALWKSMPLFQVPHSPPILTDLCSQLHLFKQGLPFAVVTRYATKEVHEKNHYETGCWATTTQQDRDTAEEKLMSYWNPAMKNGRSRQIIDWRATCTAWGVPEWLNGKPKIRVNR